MGNLALTGRVEVVAAAPHHVFHKLRVREITLLAGSGVQGDAHCGAGEMGENITARGLDLLALPRGGSG